MAPELAAGRIHFFFEPMNEPEPDPLPEMNSWLTAASTSLQNEYGIPCLSGVADPVTVTDPNLTATVHYYPYAFNPQQGKIEALLCGRNVLFEEGGEASRLFGFGLDHDKRLRDYLTDLYFRTNSVDWGGKTVRPLAQPAICL